MTASILVVEDEPAIQELVAVTLTRNGHTVRRSATAAEAAKIARMAREIHATPTKNALARLSMVNHVSDVSIGMLRRSLDAFARLDAAAAARVIGEDATIDAEFQAIVRQLITFMMEDPRTITTSINILWVAKAFERVGDHAKNIAEQVIYIVKGRDVRHTPLAEVQREAMR